MQLPAMNVGTAPAVASEVAKVVVTDADGLVLLVKERGALHESDGPIDRTDPASWIKRPGWGLPGGKVEGTLGQMREGILEQLRRQGIGLERFVQEHARLGKQFPDLEHVVLTCIKEVLEEAGVFAVPTDIRLWQCSNQEVVWLVRATPLGRGPYGSQDVHIERQAWFPRDRLPETGMYLRARDMLRVALMRPERMT